MKYFLSKTNRMIALLVIFVVVVIALVWNIPKNKQGALNQVKNVRHDSTLTLPRGEVLVHIADTAYEQRTGLSFRPSLQDNEGMFFVFDKAGQYSFWMKDMNFPIDIIWISEEGQVIFIKEKVATSTYPEMFTNGPAAKYVLEVNAGKAKEYGLYLGTKITLPTLK